MGSECATVAQLVHTRTVQHGHKTQRYSNTQIPKNTEILKTYIHIHVHVHAAVSSSDST